MNSYLYNERYSELSKQLENLEKMKNSLSSTNGKIVSNVTDGFNDSFSTQTVDNSRKLIAINQEIERIKNERQKLAEAQREQSSSDLKSQIENLKPMSEEEKNRKRDLYETVKKRYKSAAFFTRLMAKMQGEGLKREAEYTIEELQFLANYEQKKPNYMEKNLDKTREKMEKQGIDSKKINKAVGKRRWDQFAKAVNDKALLHRQMDMDKESIR